jgi:pimeloyl-ACP methyl ester carboxylesterase
MAGSENRDWERIPLLVTFPDTAQAAETYGFAGASRTIHLEGQLFRPRTQTDTVHIFMHPSSTLQLMPMPAALADAGLAVICAASRYPKDDRALIMEKVLIDVGAWVRHAREVLGYRRVVLVGWSGGGSLSLFYQAEAEAPSIKQTPAGDPIDIAAAHLTPADGVIFIAAHLSRAETLTEWLDPSVIDEADPDHRDAELDIYAPLSRQTPPFSAAFVQQFRAAQILRNRKITAWVQEKLAQLRQQGGPEQERAFVVHRTMCDVRWIDSTVDPNQRRPNHCYLGDPRTANVSPIGLARFSSLRSWLSQWSYDLSNAKGPVNAARIRRTPVLQIENGADDAVPATHGPIIQRALATQDKRYHRIDGATHYYLNQPEQLRSCIAHILNWNRTHGF